MKMLKNIVTIGVGIIILFTSVACTKDPISTSKTDNPEIVVELLFENDGVKVYRFYDEGRHIYYTDARGKTSWVGGNGKQTRTYNVETVDK